MVTARKWARHHQSSEYDGAAHAKQGAALDGQCGCEGMRHMAPRMHDILKQRLHRPAQHNLCLIAEFERHLIIPKRLVHPRKRDGVAIEGACLVGDMGANEGSAELIVSPAWQHA